MTYPSIGFDDVEDRDFDLVAANIPGKANEEVIASWLRDAALSVRDKGQIAIVVVSPLEPFVSEVISGMPGAKIVLSKRRSGHTVFIYAVDHVGEAHALRRARLIVATTIGLRLSFRMDRSGSA